MFGSVPEQCRYIAYSPIRGIYLGRGVWANDKGEKPEFALTYKTVKEAETAANESTVGDPPEFTIREVLPTGPNNTATKDDCSNRLLPIW